MNRLLIYCLVGVLGVGFVACRKETPAPKPTPQEVPSEKNGGYRGFYLLNQGAWKTNKSSLDYYDFAQGKYLRDVYTQANPEMVKGLGDTGNDIQEYGGKLYIVLNGSNKIEVLDARSTKHVGEVALPNARFICFWNGKGYATSYVAPDAGDNGEVVEIDTASYKILRRVNVGRRPEGLAAVDGKLYIAKSGADGVYEKTLTVVDITTLQVVGNIEVALNLQTIRQDSHGQLWVTSLGNYTDAAPSLYCLSKTGTEYTIAKNTGIACHGFDIRNDSLFYYSSIYNPSGQAENSYGIIDVKKREKLASSFLVGSSVQTPYCLRAEPGSGNLYITDALDYKSSGTLYCYSVSGTKKWQVKTGDLPACIAFVK